jgi:hypothetical protein
MSELTCLIGHNPTMLIIAIPTVIRIKKTALLSQKWMTKYEQYKNKVGECS